MVEQNSFKQSPLDIYFIIMIFQVEFHFLSLFYLFCVVCFRFYRSVAYRQFVRFVWGYSGNNKRLPLPCCVYNAIRKKLPNPDSEKYTGFELDEDLPSY